MYGVSVTEQLHIAEAVTMLLPRQQTEESDASSSPADGGVRCFFLASRWRSQMLLLRRLMKRDGPDEEVYPVERHTSEKLKEPTDSAENMASYSAATDRELHMIVTHMFIRRVAGRNKIESVDSQWIGRQHDWDTATALFLQRVLMTGGTDTRESFMSRDFEEISREDAEALVAEHHKRFGESECQHCHRM